MINAGLNLGNLSSEQRAQLEKRLLEKRKPAKSLSTVPASHRGCLSLAQESLWFLDQLEPNSPMYNIPQAVRVTGPLDVGALEKAFQTIVLRHDALRVRFAAVNGKPVQSVDGAAEFVMRVVDLSLLPSQEREVQADKLVQEEIRKPFRLDTDMMVRAVLLKLASEEHIVVTTMHHIISDLQSFAIFNRELELCYASWLRGVDPVLPVIETQFPQVVACHRSRLDGPGYQQQLNYWKQQLGGELPALEIPTDHPRSAIQTFNGSRIHFQIGRGLCGNLKRLARESNVTSYVMLLAAFQTLLHRYSGQNRVIVGTPLSDRNRTETELLIGYFINTLPIRSEFTNDLTFRELLGQTQARVLGALSNQAIPVEKLVEELRIPRSPGRNPLFQIVFQFVPELAPALSIPGCRTELLPVETGTSKFDLTLTMGERGGELAGNIEYNADLFERATFERWLAHFETLLGSICASPHERVTKLRILPDSERDTVLLRWNATRTEYPRHATIPEVFEQIAQASPASIAVEFEKERLTYAELSKRSDQWAKVLQRAGVAEGALVGFCVERSIDMVVGLLAVLKAGGAYVTLDPKYPGDRLNYMLRDSGAKVLVTTSKFKATFEDKELISICLDEDPGNDFAVKEPLAPTTPDSLAYVIYTSGSTGNPKGVAVPHRGVVRLVKNTNYLPFEPSDVFLQFAPLSFDASTLEIWGPLLNGAKLVLFPPEFRSLEQLGEIIREKHITTLWLTAGLFHQMIDHHSKYLGGLRYLLAGGDVLSPPHVKNALRSLPQTMLINGYGPTENTTFTCCYAVPRNWNGTTSVPIGKPISNTSVYILDNTLQPTPIGIVGELYIGGDGLARGYLNAEELTEQKFIPNPIPGTPETMLYRSGDLARWLPNGHIEFIGRRDFQVKVRGFRIELAEIESTLRQHPSVRENVVISRRDDAGATYLVAYIVPQVSGKIPPTELREYLEQKLPAHMIPSDYVLLAELPLNLNGKVDRGRLPAPLRQGSGQCIAGPRNEIEQTLVEIWSEVLAGRRIGVNDNFFEIGGHSLLATRVLSRISSRLRVDLPLRSLFEAPTIALLAGKVVASKNVEGTGPILRRSRGAQSNEQPLVRRS